MRLCSVGRHTCDRGGRAALYPAPGMSVEENRGRQSVVWASEAAPSACGRVLESTQFPTKTDVLILCQQRPQPRERQQIALDL